MEDQDRLPFELAFNGTPAELGAVAHGVFCRAVLFGDPLVFDVYGLHVRGANRRFYTNKCVLPPERELPPPDATPVTVRFWTPDTWPLSCVIVACKALEKESILYVYCEEKAWPKLEPWWDTLHAELVRRFALRENRPFLVTLKNVLFFGEFHEIKACTDYQVDKMIDQGKIFAPPPRGLASLVLERKPESAINDLKSQLYVSILPELCLNVLSLIRQNCMPLSLRGREAWRELSVMAARQGKPPKVLLEETLLECLQLFVGDPSHEPQTIRLGKSWLKDEAGKEALLIPRELPRRDRIRWLIQQAYGLMAQPSDQRRRDPKPPSPCPSCGRAKLPKKGGICPACEVGIPGGWASQIEDAPLVLEPEGYPDLRPLRTYDSLEADLVTEDLLNRILEPKEFNRVLEPQEIELCNLLQDDPHDEDLALQLGISRENVRQRRHRLKEKIKAFLTTPF